MSTLVIVLVAAMAVPGDVPGKVSSEMEQRLDLSGKWQAILYRRGDVFCGEAYIGEDGRQKAFLFSSNHGMGHSTVSWQTVPIDEGNRRFRIGDLLGIYQYDGDSLRICIGEKARHRPTSFQATNDQSLLILHRVNPR